MSLMPRIPIQVAFGSDRHEGLELIGFQAAWSYDGGGSSIQKTEGSFSD